MTSWKFEAWIKIEVSEYIGEVFHGKVKIASEFPKDLKEKMKKEPISSSFMTLQQGEITVSVTKQVGRISWSVIWHSHAIIMSMYKLFKGCVYYIFASLFCKPKGDHL